MKFYKFARDAKSGLLFIPFCVLVNIQYEDELLKDTPECIGLTEHNPSNVMVPPYGMLSIVFPECVWNLFSEHVLHWILSGNVVI